MFSGATTTQGTSVIHSKQSAVQTLLTQNLETMVAKQSVKWGNRKNYKRASEPNPLNSKQETDMDGENYFDTSTSSEEDKYPKRLKLGTEGHNLNNKCHDEEETDSVQSEPEEEVESFQFG